MYVCVFVYMNEYVCVHVSVWWYCDGVYVCACVCPSRVWVLGWNLPHQARWQAPLLTESSPSPTSPFSWASASWCRNAPINCLTSFHLPSILASHKAMKSRKILQNGYPCMIVWAFASLRWNYRSALGFKTLKLPNFYFRCMSTRMAVSRSSWVTLVWPPLSTAPCTQSVAPQHTWLQKSLQRLGKYTPLSFRACRGMRTTKELSHVDTISHRFFLPLPPHFSLSSQSSCQWLSSSSKLVFGLC